MLKGANLKTIAVIAGLSTVMHVGDWFNQKYNNVKEFFKGLVRPVYEVDEEC